MCTTYHPYRGVVRYGTPTQTGYWVYQWYGLVRYGTGVHPSVADKKKAGIMPHSAARGAHSAIMALAVPFGGVWLPAAVAAFTDRNRRIVRLGHGFINWCCEWRCPLYPRKRTFFITGVYVR